MIRKFFAIDEIESSTRLQWIFWALWGIVIFDISIISYGPIPEGEPPLCWEHISNCSSLLFTSVLPLSYLYTKMTAILLLFLFFTCFFAMRKNWLLACTLLSGVVVGKFIWNMFIFDQATSNFDYFLFIPALTFLFSRSKIQNLRFLWSLLYLFAALVKLDEGWIMGTYFTSLVAGLPFVPDSTIPIVTNLTIIFELLGSLGLISRNPRWATLSLWAWTGFHLYSAILVGYMYPIRCLAFLWAIFGSFNPIQVMESRQYKPALRGIGCLVGIYFTVANILPWLISTNPHETFEGLNYSFHMFDANHQCLSRYKRYNHDDQLLEEREFGSSNPMARCYPQFVLQKLKRMYCGDQVLGEKYRVEWEMMHSKDGGPFYKIVHVQDACIIEFRAFRHNSWITTQGEGARLVGYPERNYFYSYSRGPIPKIYPLPQIELSGMQKLIRDYYPAILVVYQLIWLVAFCRLLQLGLIS